MIDRGSRYDERGQILPLVVLLMVLGGVLMIGVTRVATRAAGADHARATADLVALAGAVGGQQAAGQVAAANGASVVAYEVLPVGVRVEIAVGERHEVAEAVAGPSGDESPALRAVLARAGQVLGTPVAVRQWGSDGVSVGVDAATTARLTGKDTETGLCAGPSQAWFEICPPGQR